MLRSVEWYLSALGDSLSDPSPMVQQSPLKMGLTQPSMQWVPRAVRSVYSGQAVRLFADIISSVEHEYNELYLHIAFSFHIMVLRHSGHTLSLSG